MRLAILTPSFLPTYNGMTFATMQHASMLTDLGHQVTVVAACPNEHRAAVTAALSVRGIGFLPVNIAGSGLFSRPVVGDAQAVVEQITSLNFKIILVEGRYFWGYHIMPHFENRGSRIALVSHGAAVSRFKWSVVSAAQCVVYGLYRWLHERQILRALDAVAVLSAHEDEERFRDARLYRGLGLNPVVVGNTSIESVAREVRKTVGEFGKLRIAVVGEMSQTKNQLAAIGLAESNDAISFIRFYFQAETKYSRLVASRARNRDITTFQYRTGLDREAVMRSLGDIDLILCLSMTEAQPLSIIDGLACGLPFLSTSVGCMPSMRGGLVSEISGMRAIVRRLAGDSAAMEELAREARIFYEVVHSESAVKPALAALISLAMIGKSIG